MYQLQSFEPRLHELLSPRTHHSESEKRKKKKAFETEATIIKASISDTVAGMPSYCRQTYNLLASNVHLQKR